MKVSACQACDALWEEYSQAIHEHIALEGKLEAAGVLRSHVQVMELIPVALSAWDRRRGLRKRIMEHERAAHPTAD